MTMSCGFNHGIIMKPWDFMGIHGISWDFIGSYFESSDFVISYDLMEDFTKDYCNCPIDGTQFGCMLT